MGSRLDEIVASARLRVAESKRRVDLRDLEKRAEQHAPRGFREALKQAALRRPAIIAELKKASPSRGVIRKDFDPASLATGLAEAGAAALSVLTDEQYFQGSLENLHIASRQTTLPCLRKDFIVDQWQLTEARAFGADAVLLIVAALSQAELTSLAEASRRVGLDVLCEAHDEDELQRALDAGCDVLGINSRDLRTFEVDVQAAFRLVDKIPTNVVRVAESGIRSGEDIARLRAAGYDAFLIGESLMKAAHPGDALRQLLAEAVMAAVR